MEPDYSFDLPAFEPLTKRLYTPSETDLLSSNKRFRTSYGHKNLYQSTIAASKTRDELINQAAYGKTTVPIPFMLKTDERARSVSKTPVEQPRKIFKAKPVPKSCKTPTFALKPSERSTTKPMEFNLSRSQINSENTSQKQPSHSDFKAPTSVPTRTAFKPLNLQPDARRGSWNGWPKSGPMQKENKPSFSFTVVEPFKLMTEERSKPKPMPETSCFVFKSKPMPDFSNPFVPKPSGFEGTKQLNLALNSDLRAYERELFDKQIQMKQAEMEAIEAERLQQQADFEAADIQTYRMSLEFKARPMPNLSPFELKYPAVVLTIPASPDLKTAKRADQKAKASEELPVFMDID